MSLLDARKSNTLFFLKHSFKLKKKNLFADSKASPLIPLFNPIRIQLSLLKFLPHELCTAPRTNL